MFEPTPKSGRHDGAGEEGREEKKKDEARKAARGASAKPKKPGLMETMVLDFDRIVIEEGYTRFLDQTTKPPFSQDIGHLALTVRNLSNTRDGRRSTLALQGIVGGDAALDMRGELSGLGDDFFADLVGELRDFSVASANPYANSMLAWAVKEGKLGLRVHYRIEHDRLTGENEIVVKNLQVAKGAGVRRGAEARRPAAGPRRRRAQGLARRHLVRRSPSRARCRTRSWTGVRPSGRR